MVAAYGSPAAVPPGGGPPSASQLFALASLLDDAVVVLDDDGAIIGFNERAEEVFGYERSEIVGQPVDYLLADPDAPGLAERSDTIETLGNGPMILGRRKSGEEFPAIAGVLRCADEATARFVAVIRDRSHRDRLERLLVQAQAVARLGSWEWELSADQVFWSDELNRIFGVERGPIGPVPFETFLEILPSQVHASFRAHIEASLDTLDRFDFGEKIVSAGGDVRHLRNWGGVLTNEAGRPVRVIGVVQDVTDQREAEERMVRTAEAEAARTEAERVADRLRDLRDFSVALSEARTLDDVATVVLDRGFDILEAERGGIGVVSDDGTRLEALRFHGYPPEVAEHFSSIPIEADVHVCEAIRTGDPIWIEDREVYEARYPELFALIREISSETLAAVPLRRAPGPVIGALMVGFTRADSLGRMNRMLTVVLAQQVAVALARARAFDAERDAREAAESTARAREDALAVVAHDLRQPLNAVSNAANLLLEERFDEDQRTELLEMISRGASSMDHLVHDLLDAARMEAGSFSIAPVRTDLSELVRDAVDETRAAIVDREVEFRLEMSDPVGGVVADPQRLRRALANLLSNAVEHGAEDGTVTVRVTGDRDEVIVCVRDEGAGVPEEERQHLFDRFWQGDGRKEAGVGLGLAIVKGIVDAHGGRVWVEGGPGEGTSFYCAFRRRLAEPDGLVSDAPTIPVARPDQSTGG